MATEAPAAARTEAAEANGDHDSSAAPSQPIIISDGAALALGNALSRFITVNSGTKRPRASGKVEGAVKPIVLAENEEVKKEAEEREESKKKYKLQKQRKHKFETNARVIPDVATDHQLERSLLETATNGAVLFFNTVTKTQKINSRLLNKKKKKGKKLDDKDKKVINKQSFMNLMKVGISKSTAKALPMNIDMKKQNKDENEAGKEDDDKEDADEEEKEGSAGEGRDGSEDNEDESSEGEGDDEEGDDEEGDEDEVNGQSYSAPKWLKDDFLTSGASKMNRSNWDEKSTDHADDGGSSEESDEDDMDMDGPEDSDEDMESEDSDE